MYFCPYTFGDLAAEHEEQRARGGEQHRHRVQAAEVRKLEGGEVLCQREQRGPEVSLRRGVRGS